MQREIRSHMERMYLRWREIRKTKPDAEPVRLTCSQLRVVVAKVLGVAWKEVCDNPRVVKSVFRSVGLSLPFDGSEDDKMKIQGCAQGVPPGLVIG